MFNRTALLAAVATVTLSAAVPAMAQMSTIPYDATRDTNVPDKELRTGATDSLGVRNNTARSDDQLRQPAVWKGQRAQNQRLNVGNSLPEKTVFGRVGDIDNSNTGAMNRLPSGATDLNTAVIASDRVTYVAPAAPVTTERTWVSTPPADTTARDTTVRTDTTIREDRVATTDGIDHRYLKPADPAVVTPDYKMNAGIDRTLAQDKNVYGNSQRMNEYRVVEGETALRDISNNPIDSQKDARFRNPAIPENTNTAVPASERIERDVERNVERDTTLAPATQPSSMTPAPAAVPATPSIANPVRPDEYQSTWSSESDRMAKDDNAVRPARTPDKDQPAPMKGERALNALDNTRNPVPDKTVFGKTGDIRSNGPVNNAGEPLPAQTNP